MDQLEQTYRWSDVPRGGAPEQAAEKCSTFGAAAWPMDSRRQGTNNMKYPIQTLCACVCVSCLQASSKVCQTIKIGIMTAIAATCKWCGQEFSSKTKYEKHAKTCRPFACGQCGERLKSKTAL